MAGLRVILGIFEAGFYPGCVYLLSTWYPRYELQKRNAGFYLIGSMASAFGGILAYGLMQLNGRAHLSGWRWIFIVSATPVSYHEQILTDATSCSCHLILTRRTQQIEGVLTCVLAFLAYLLIVDFPENSPKSWRFLSQKEADLVVARIDHDRNDVETTPFHLGSYLRNGLDSKVWGFSWLYMLTTTNTYAIAYFLPIILQGGLGFDVASAQCLVAPPYVASAIVMIIQGYLGDKLRLRGPIIIFNCALGTFRCSSPETPLTSCNTPTNNTPVRYPRPWSLGLREAERRALLWRLPRHHCLQRKLPGVAHIPVEQHPRPVETSLHFRHADRRRRHRWYHRHQRVQARRLAKLPPRYSGVPDR